MLSPEDIKLLVIHCSNTPDQKDIGASEIHQMHLNFGWDGIGYHKISEEMAKLKMEGQILDWGTRLWKKTTRV